MNIEDCKKNMVLPENGTKVRTVINEKEDGKGWFVHDRHIKSRKNGTGTIHGFVPGCGGDVWWVKHDDNSIGAYLSTEVNDT